MIYEQLRDRIRAERARRPGDRHRRPGARRQAARRAGRAAARHARRPRPRPRRRPRRARRAGGRPLGRAPLRPAGPDDAGGPRGLADRRRVRRVLRPAAADVDLRRRRLHRRAGQGRQGARLPRHGRATPARSSPPAGASRWPTRSSCRGRRRCSSGAATTLGPRDAVCILTHDPKFDVPGRAGRAGHRRRLHRRDGQPHDARQAAASGCSRPASSRDELDRLMSPIGLDLGARTPGGDGDLDLRRDHRHPHRQVGPVLEGLRRPDPRLNVGRRTLDADRRSPSAVGSPKRTER